MGTLIKRKGVFPSIVSKSVNNYFDDFITKDLFEMTDKNFDAFSGKLPSKNLKKNDINVEVELAAPTMKKMDVKVEIDDDPLIFSEKKEVKTKENFTRKEFNYRSFCRLPNC